MRDCFHELFDLHSIPIYARTSFTATHSPNNTDSPLFIMASRVAAAAKGIRFASHANVANASNPWLAERIAVKEHAGRKFKSLAPIIFSNLAPALYKLRRLVNRNPPQNNGDAL